MMSSQYIYLLQEREFKNLKENIYKVGMTKQKNHKRFNQYPKDSVLLFQMICNNCKNIERLVLEKFKVNFKQRKDIGNEYFEGEYKGMIDIIYLTIKNELNTEEEQEEEDDDDKYKEQEDKKKFNLLCEKIRKIFPDYRNDESFGGNKKYIKISYEFPEYRNDKNNTYVVNYINSKLMHNLHYNDNDYIIEYHMSDYDNLQYFNHLINKKLVCVDKTYDINSTKFISKINKTKFYINIENYDDLQSNLQSNLQSKIDTESRIIISEEIKIRQLFHCNTIINTCLYSTMEDESLRIFKKNENLKDYDTFRIYVGIYYYNMITLYRINSKYYDYTFLRKYIPYVIRWDINNNYYIVNREYKYIGLNREPDYTCKGHAYLFDDGKKPWDNRNNYIVFCNEYIKIINKNSLKECLNTHNYSSGFLE